MQISRERSYVIRGLAIWAVVLVHIMAYLRGIYTGDRQVFWVFLDQASRFSVPVFIMLSGYGLAVQYTHKRLQWRSFWQSRLLKLLPAYLLWSVLSIILIRLIPEWSYGNQPQSLWVQLLLGQADYQLYFIPVIMQLYILFPFLWFFRRYPHWILAILVAVQVSTFTFFASRGAVTDRWEYVIALSWVAYFGLGIYMALRPLSRLVQLISSIVAPLALGGLVGLAVTQIRGGLDPLPALKFTRIPVLIYGLSASIAVAGLRLPVIARRSEFLRRICHWSGQHSFAIFLSHTIALRIFHALWMQQLPIFVIMAVTVVWVAALVLTLRWRV